MRNTNYDITKPMHPTLTAKVQEALTGAGFTVMSSRGPVLPNGVYAAHMHLTDHARDEIVREATARFREELRMIECEVRELKVVGSWSDPIDALETEAA